jgi:hypothetical protein
LRLPDLHREKQIPSFFADASTSGKDVFFFTREQLEGQEVAQGAAALYSASCPSNRD